MTIYIYIYNFLNLFALHITFLHLIFKYFFKYRGYKKKM